ncbi:hypothetical protein [Pedobacter sp. UBA5917]|jgi:hypothetical protein|uniref:hypothetical protein n=1 Tax=Pedobacter sp. UBA5917 TaxID=1947061 RepID=UPI0025F56CF0|nr:hypothetical protein [Pedobacter sp. UBA5917]
MKNTLQQIQKISVGMWLVVWLIFFISTISEIIKDFSAPTNSILFLDGIKQTVSIGFYLCIGWLLFKLVYNDRQYIATTIVSEEGIKKIKAIWYAIFSYLIFKFFFISIISWFILPGLVDVQQAEVLGYGVKVGIKPFTDLFIANVIVWALLLVINYSLRLKKENDLTI